MTIDDEFLLEEERPRGWRRLVTGPSGRRLRRGLFWAGLVLLAAILLYYPIGMIWLHQIDDDVEFFAPVQVPEGGSRAVGLAAALIEREVDQNAWVANDPFFLPGWALDNMPNYQQGIVSALSRFAIEMTDQMGRSRGSSRADPDLDKAAGLLKYPGTIWLFDPSTSWAPTASSESQYRAARQALLSYNRRLVAGQAVYDRRADNLLATIERMAADLGSASAVVDQHIEQTGGAWLDFKADDIFYNTKGRIYAYGLLLRELGADFAAVIDEREMRAVWDQTVDTFLFAAELQPWVVSNGSADGMVLPNHLLAQGFYLLRARTQLRELANILLK
ncbi:MAG: hypothetical protein BroJett029_17710 [Alphaproteobacteria bacterium]|nr:MAG: hypothetical protein BroJett029_17710 [Alphaproteobacteria bacterium]